MSDTEIFINYRERDEEKSMNITCDRGIYKKYLDMYNHENILTKEKRFQNCGLYSLGNEKSQEFLIQITKFWKEESGYCWEFDDYESTFEKLKNLEIISVYFNCY